MRARSKVCTAMKCLPYLRKYATGVIVNTPPMQRACKIVCLIAVVLLVSVGLIWREGARRTKSIKTSSATAGTTAGAPPPARPPAPPPAFNTTNCNTTGNGSCYIESQAPFCTAPDCKRTADAGETQLRGKFTDWVCHHLDRHVLKSDEHPHWAHFPVHCLITLAFNCLVFVCRPIIYINTNMHDMYVGDTKMLTNRACSVVRQIMYFAWFCTLVHLCALPICVQFIVIVCNCILLLKPPSYHMLYLVFSFALILNDQALPTKETVVLKFVRDLRAALASKHFEHTTNMAACLLLGGGVWCWFDMHDTVAHCCIYVGVIILSIPLVCAWCSGDQLREELLPLTTTFVEKDKDGIKCRRYMYIIYKKNGETRACQDTLKAGDDADKAAFMQRVERWKCIGAVFLVVYFLLSMSCQFWQFKQAVIRSIRVAQVICTQIPLWVMKFDTLDLSSYMMISQGDGGMTCTCTSKLLLLLAAKVLAHILYHTLVLTYMYQSK